MDATGSLFSQTLQDITNTKLDELAKKRKTFEDLKAETLTEARRNEDAIRMLQVLVAGVKSCFSVSTKDGQVVRGSTKHPHLEIDLRNLDRFLRQAGYDPSVSLRVLEQWRQSLLRHLDIQSLKFSYASLYGQLTTEWLQSERQVTAHSKDEESKAEGFELISPEKIMASRLEWESLVFEAANVDVAAVNKFLQQTFDDNSSESKQTHKALEFLRTRVANFERSLMVPDNFTEGSMSWIIDGLLASDLLSDEKRAVLKDFGNNPVIVSEIIDVLNMRMAALDSWSWGNEVLLEQRRQLSGSFNIYMHEDILQAIFLQYLGVKWSIFWKHAFSVWRKSKGVWQSSRASVPLVDRRRREYYLGMETISSREASVQSKKRDLYRAHYFCSQLLDSVWERIVGEEGDEEADVLRPLSRQRQTAQKPVHNGQTKQTARVPTFRKDVADWDDSDSECDSEYEGEISLSFNSRSRKNPMKAKQKLLHLLSSDIIIKTQLSGEITCFRTQFDDFYPSLPHSTIKSVLLFFGVSQKWLTFFERFLQAPLRFKDDSTAEPRMRKRGTPGSHVLSEVFGEVILFCLDFKINRVTKGEFLWRMHDDSWFWSSNHGECVKAWSTIQSFAKTMGLSLNEARSGSARMLQRKNGGKAIVTSGANDPALPQGQIRWGMLYLNPESGRFEIDQDMVEKHIDELSHQLQDKSNSVFAWIQAWNTYATIFFTSNFGKPANCYGRVHVDSMLATHERIQRKVFSSAADSVMLESGRDGNVVAFLKYIIQQRFGTENIPDGYFFFPVELGGLGLRSPFIGLLQTRDAIIEDPSALIDKFLEAEKEAYERFKKEFEHRSLDDHQASAPKFRPEHPHNFMPFDEFIKYREELPYGYDNELAQVHSKLLQQPSGESIDCDDKGQVEIALNALKNQKLCGILSDWKTMEPYWKWVAQLYGPEIIERFGGLNIVEPGLLPVGMVSLFRSGRVKWQD